MTDEVRIQQVSPGECPPAGCPPATRIECISVTKVYDSCFQTENLTRLTTLGGLFPSVFIGDVLPCSLTEGDTISCEVLQKEPINDTGFFNITLLVRIPLTIGNQLNGIHAANAVGGSDKVFTFVKTVTLCCPEGTELDCSESTLLFCRCIVAGLNNSCPVTPMMPENGFCPTVPQQTVNNTVPVTPVTPVTPMAAVEVECTLQVCLVVKCLTVVQLLVPSYGFCVPAPCIALPGVCPPSPPPQCF